MIPITDLNFDINSSSNPQNVLVEANIGVLSKKNYYQPLSLEGENYILNNNEIFYNSSLCYKERDKTVQSNYSEWLNELALVLDVKNFIKNYQLESSIQEAVLRINDFFDNHTIQFELVIDEEEFDETLLIYIVTPSTTRDASKRTREMFRNWSLIRKHNFYNHISITTRRIDAI
jgi:hypothetical protein